MKEQAAKQQAEPQTTNANSDDSGNGASSTVEVTAPDPAQAAGAEAASSAEEPKETPITKIVAGKIVTNYITAIGLATKESNINEKNGAGETPLTLAVKRACAEKAGSKGFDPKTMIYQLLNYGADINMPNSAGETPLNLAIEGVNLEIALYLLDYRDPEGKNIITEEAKETALGLLESKYEGTKQKPEEYKKLLKKLQQASQQRASLWSLSGLRSSLSKLASRTTRNQSGDSHSGGVPGGGGTDAAAQPNNSEQSETVPTLVSLMKDLSERIFGSTSHHENSITQQVSDALTESNANNPDNEHSEQPSHEAPTAQGETSDHLKQAPLSPEGERENKHKAAKTASTDQKQSSEEQSEEGEVVNNTGMAASSSDLFTGPAAKEQPNENTHPNQMLPHHQESQPPITHKEQLTVAASPTAAIATSPHSENAPPPETDNTQAPQQPSQRPLVTKTSSRTSFAHTTPEHSTFAAVVKADRTLEEPFEKLLASCAEGAAKGHENKWNNTPGKLQLNQGEALDDNQAKIIDSLVAASVYKFQLEPITIRGGTEAQQIAAMRSALERGFTDITVVEVKATSDEYKNLIAITKKMKDFRGHQDILETIKANTQEEPKEILAEKAKGFCQNKAATSRAPFAEIQPNSGPSGMH